MNNLNEVSVMTEESEESDAAVNEETALTISPRIPGRKHRRLLEAPAVTRELGLPLEPLTLRWAFHPEDRRLGYEERTCLRFD